jgi:hypothetical protein
MRLILPQTCSVRQAARYPIFRDQCVRRSRDVRYGTSAQPLRTVCYRPVLAISKALSGPSPTQKRAPRGRSRSQQRAPGGRRRPDPLEPSIRVANAIAVAIAGRAGRRQRHPAGGEDGRARSRHRGSHDSGTGTVLGSVARDGDGALSSASASVTLPGVGRTGMLPASPGVRTDGDAPWARTSGHPRASKLCPDRPDRRC